MSNTTSKFTTEEQRFHGVAAAPGIAQGKVLIYKSEELDLPSHPIREDEVDGEIRKLEKALLKTRTQIMETQQRLADAIGTKDADIFDAHLLVVEDHTLLEEVVRLVSQELRNVEEIYAKVSRRYAQTLMELDDDYLRERAIDIEDVTKRVLRNLVGQEGRGIPKSSEPFILLAVNLTPSDTAALDRDLVIGMATDGGSVVSHSAIMARSLGIPSVVALRDCSTYLRGGETALLDGYGGFLIINPSEETLYEYSLLRQSRLEVQQALEGLRETESTTVDGRAVVLSANIERSEDVAGVRDNGAHGVGLYRTEFFFMQSRRIPTEDEQYENYIEIAENLAPDPLIIRTLDLGGDKIRPDLMRISEANPFLGWRAIRFCLEEEEIFKDQLRAILRASVHQNVALMYPMISGLEELRKANAMLEECKQELGERGQLFNSEIQVGAMIEIPSAAQCADMLAQEVDFFSVGTNDLIQYTIAIDRLNNRVAHLYEPTHPAILRMLKFIADSAHQAGIWAGLCGEMAGDVALTPILVGLGIDELSVSSVQVPRVKRAVQALNYDDCQALVAELMQMDTAGAILTASLQMGRKYYPEILS
ncbi:MAG: phosphoenolpyruvate--protein phosphotransferase [Verrucomicrobiales bacterium]